MAITTNLNRRPAPPRIYQRRDDFHEGQFVAITFQDGSVGIMNFILDPNVPNPESLIGFNAETGRREATPEAIQAEIDKSSFSRSPAVSWRLIEQNAPPNDRTYRDAWKDDGKAIVHDMDKAKEIHRNILRAERATAFTDLDVQFMVALEQNDSATAQQVTAEKQTLRDITDDPRIDAAATIDDLKALTLDALKTTTPTTATKVP